MLNEYKYIIGPITALFLCQLIKFIIESYKNKDLKWERLFNGSGGMPSSHSSLSFTLTFLLMFNEGLSSPITAISLVFSLIVCYDAMGVRFESGKQAKILNNIVNDLNTKKKIEYELLKEELGHKPLEVLVGIILSILVSLVFTFLVK